MACSLARLVNNGKDSYGGKGTKHDIDCGLRRHVDFSMKSRRREE